MAVDRDVLPDALQENVLTLVASSDKYAQLVMLNVEIDLYSTVYARTIAKACYSYVHQYGKPPRDHLPDLLTEALAQKEDGPFIKRYLVNIATLRDSGFNEEFVVNQLDKFTRFMRVKKTAADLVQALDQNNMGSADKIISSYSKMPLSGFDRGITLKEVGAMLVAGKIHSTTLPLGIKPLDEAELGPAKQELHLFMAPPKRGKTWFLLHLCKQGLLNRHRVVYVTLEMSAEKLGVRMLQSLFSLTYREAKVVQLNKYKRTNGKLILDMQQIERKAIESQEGKDILVKRLGLNKKKGTSYRDVAERMSENLVIKRFPTGSLDVDGLERYLEQLMVIDRFVPDLVIVDYPDLMKISADKFRLNLGGIYKDLRGLAVERNFALGAASQSNRGSVDKMTITEGDVGEDFSKIAISDVVFSYNQTPEERSQNMARIFVVAARNDRDKFDVKITQAYEVGQFCLSAEVIPAAEYESFIPAGTPQPAYRSRRGSRKVDDE